MAGYIGSGDLFAAVTRNGVKGDFFRLGNASKLELKENSDTKTRMSKGRSNYGSALDTVVLKKPADVAITLDDLNKQNLALMFMGIAETNAAGVTTVTGEAAVAPADGGLMLLAFGGASDVTATLDDGTTPVTITLVDSLTGLVSVDAAVAAEGVALVVAYTSTVTASTTIQGGLQPDVTMHVLMAGVNLVDDSPSKIEIFKTVLTPSSGLDFLSDDFTELELTGVANAPDGKDHAYEITSA